MSDPLPSTLEELYTMAAALDAELSRSRTLLDHLPLPIRPETIAEHSRRLEQLEAWARLLGLLTNDGMK